MAEKKPAQKAGRTAKPSTAKSKTKALAADTATPNTAASSTPTRSDTPQQTAPKAAQATVAAKNGLNVRTSPEKGNNVKRVLPYGTEVTVQAQTTDAQGTEWAQIAPHEFIMRRFLQMQ